MAAPIVVSFATFLESHHFGIETAVRTRQTLRGSHLESHHFGIETCRKRGGSSRRKDLESHHFGIETKKARPAMQNGLPWNRTILELKRLSKLEEIVIVLLGIAPFWN